MTSLKHLDFKKFFQDKKGNVVVWQTPNFPLTAWFVLKLISWPLSDGTAKTGIAHLSSAFLFIWAYLEVTQGTSYFRRVLGLVIGLGIIKSFFS